LVRRTRKRPAAMTRSGRWR